MRGLIVLILLFCTLSVSAAWYDDGWSYRVKVTVDAGQVDSDLTNFPVYVDLDDLPAAFHSNIMTNGDDLRVTKSDGTTEVPHELVSIDTANGLGELWFKADGTLSSTSNSDFYLYYGNGDASAYAEDATYGSENVWTQGYVAVYHLQEDGNTTTGGYLDSTSNDNDATGVSMTTSSDTNGQLGRAQAFDNVADYITTPIVSGATFTWSAWTNVASFSSFDAVMSIKNPVGANYMLMAYNSANKTQILTSDGVLATFGVTGLSTDTWYHYVFSRAGDTVLNGYKVHFDGVAKTPANTGMWSSSNTIWLGNWDGGSLYYDGLMDEIHIADEVRSTDWISAEYNNQDSPATFYSVGGQETAEEVGWYDNAWSNRLKITVDNTKVSADLTDFPVYINLDDIGTGHGFWTNVQADGDDIRITKSNGTTQVPVEIVNIDTSGKTGEVHFKADGTLSGSSDTSFYLYYGNASATRPAATATYGSENVWTNSYLRVYHMNEDPSGSAPQMIDSTSNGDDATSEGSMTSGDLISGQIDNSIDFDGSNDRIRGSTNTTIQGANGRTLSCWVRNDATNSDADTVVYIGTDTGAGHGYGLAVGVGGSFNWSVWTHSSFYDVAGTQSSTADIGTWVKLDATYDGTTNRLYYNGSQDATTSTTAINTQNSVIAMGDNNADNRDTDCALDEVRLSSVARSANWLSTEYNNQNTSSTFYTIGSEEEGPAGDTFDTFNTLLMGAPF